MHEKIIEQLYKSYSLNGYITESQIFDLVESENVPLFDIEYIMDQLLGKGVIIRENVVGNEEDEDETDYSDTDYEVLYGIQVRLETVLRFEKVCGQGNQRCH